MFSPFLISFESIGRTQGKLAGKVKRKQELKREEQRRKANQIRSKKREDVLAKKRGIGGNDNAPFFTAVIPLGQSANIDGFMKNLKVCDADLKSETTGRGLLNIRLHFSDDFVSVVEWTLSCFAL